MMTFPFVVQASSSACLPFSFLLVGWWRGHIRCQLSRRWLLSPLFGLQGGAGGRKPGGAEREAGSTTPYAYADRDIDNIKQTQYHTNNSSSSYSLVSLSYPRSLPFFPSTLHHVLPSRCSYRSSSDSSHVQYRLDCTWSHAT